MERLQPASNERDFVGVYPGGTLIYVLMKRRDEFDMIALPVRDSGENDNGHVLSKSLDQGGLCIVFQYWLKVRTIEAIRADMDRDKAAAAAVPDGVRHEGETAS